MTRRMSMGVGLVAGLSSVLLWVIMNFANPYTGDTEPAVVQRTGLLLLAPSLLAILAALLNRSRLMLVAFVWSLPGSLYLTLTLGIFMLFGVTCGLYLLCWLLMQREKALAGG